MKKVVVVTKEAFIAWAKNPKTNKKHKFKLTKWDTIRTANDRCPLQAWRQDLTGSHTYGYATRLVAGEKSLVLENNVIQAADEPLECLDKDSVPRRLRNLMLKTFGLKENPANQ